MGPSGMQLCRAFLLPGCFTPRNSCKRCPGSTIRPIFQVQVPLTSRTITWIRWMFLTGCLAPGTHRDFRGAVGGTLVITCRYGVGEEGHRKFWCRGADWKDCVRVVEMAQPATEEARRGRVTFKDIPREHRFVVVVGNLEKGDAGTYWCGVDRPGSVSQSAVRVAVFPGSMTTATRTLETSVGSSTLTSHESNPGCPIWLLLLFTSLLFLFSMKVVLLLSVGYTATRLVCIQPSPERL